VVIAKYVFSFECVEKSQAADKKVLRTLRKMSIYIDTPQPSLHLSYHIPRPCEVWHHENPSSVL